MLLLQLTYIQTTFIGIKQDNAFRLITNTMHVHVSEVYRLSPWYKKKQYIHKSYI